MKVLVNARFLLSQRLEGIGLHTYEILRRITRDHPEDQFIFCFDRPYDEAFVFSANVTPIIVRPPARHPLLFIWWFEVMIPRLYKKYGADLFYSPDGFIPLSKAVSKSVVVIHDLAYLHYPKQINWSERLYYQYFMPKFIARAEQIITVSQSTRDDLISHFPNAAQKTTVIYNGVRKMATNDPEISKLPFEGKQYFVALGAIHPRKNIPNLLLAFEHFKKKSDSDALLVIVGRIAWKTKVIKSTLEKLQPKKDVKFVGYLSDQNLYQVLRHSIGLIYVSLFEGFGLPIVEAMQLGVPVITSNRSSMQEIAGDAAILVDPEHPGIIAQAMIDLWSSPVLASDLKAKGHYRAKNFNWDVAAEAIYQRLIGLLS